MSFQDSNNDGIGDIQGIISRLDYLKELGINAIWLSPVYQSPGVDNGYDISDYQAIDPKYGTLDDMDELIQNAAERNIKIIMDLVVNHTSDHHEWFKQSKQSKKSAYRDFYIWRDPVNGMEPNDLQSNFSGSAWEFDRLTNQYYLHLYAKEQPDLNWENPLLRKKIYNMMNWWLDRGIGGFRMDVIDLLGKVPDEKITTNGPRLHEYIKEMNQATFGNLDVVTVGETWGANPEIAKLWSGEKRQELNMVFQFENMQLDKESGKSRWDLKALDVRSFHRIMTKWQLSLSDIGWNSLFWNNHDLGRAVTRFGDDSTELSRQHSAKGLAIYLHGMKGTPYIYQGEEIGMTNTPVKSINEVQDIESRQIYASRIASGNDPEKMIEAINIKGRDNGRRPMLWDSSKNAGFSMVSPWLPINPNYKKINVESAIKNSEDVFYIYKKLISLRKTEDVLVNGVYNNIETSNDFVVSYTRKTNNKSWIVIFNFSKEIQKFQLESRFTIKEIVVSNTDNVKLIGNLEPYDAFIIEVMDEEK